MSRMKYHRNLFSSLEYMHLPLGLDDQAVCKNGAIVQIGPVASRPLFESDESTLSKYRWRIMAGDDGWNIVSVFCEHKFGETFFLSVASLNVGQTLVLSSLASFKGEWVNGHQNDAVRVFQPKSNDGLAVTARPYGAALSNFYEGETKQQWLLLDEDGQLGGCKKQGEHCSADGQCCFGMECASKQCLHVPRQLGESCSSFNKCADPYHCGGYGGDGEQVCRELNEGEEGDKCGNVFGCKEGLFCLRKRCLEDFIGYKNDSVTGELEAYTNYDTQDGHGEIWYTSQKMWKCATTDLSSKKGKCDFDDNCICSATLPGSDEYSTYRSLVRNITSKQEELENLAHNLAAVNKFNHDMELNQDSIAWSYSSYSSEFLGQQVEVCVQDIGGFPQDCSDHTFEGIEKEEFESTCTAANSEYESNLNAVSRLRFLVVVLIPSSLLTPCVI